MAPKGPNKRMDLKKGTRTDSSYDWREDGEQVIARQQPHRRDNYCARLRHDDGARHIRCRWQRRHFRCLCRIFGCHRECQSLARLREDASTDVA